MPGPGIPHLLTDRYAIERAAGNGLLRAKAGCVNIAERHAFGGHHQMLTGILERAAAGAAVTAQGFPFMISQRMPILISKIIRHIKHDFAWSCDVPKPT